MATSRCWTEELVATLNGLPERADLLVGAVTEPLREQIHDTIPSATTFLSGLGWLHGAGDTHSETEIGRLLLVDRSTILVSTVDPEMLDERAVFGRGFRNGLVVIARRLLAQGLLPERDPR